MPTRKVLANSINRSQARRERTIDKYLKLEEELGRPPNSKELRKFRTEIGTCFSSVSELRDLAAQKKASSS